MVVGLIAANCSDASVGHGGSSAATSTVGVDGSLQPSERMDVSTTENGPATVAHTVGSAATPASGGTIVGEWTGVQLTALDVEPDEVRLGVLSDFTLAGLTSGLSKILIVGPDGSVVERVPMGGSPNQMLVHPGDLAELIDDAGATTWISLAAGHRGEAVQAPRRPTVEGAGCFRVVHFEGEHDWKVPEDRCNTRFDDPIEQADGSVLLTTASTVGDNESIEVSAISLDVGGSIRKVVLGSHAVDGAEGWIKYQPTQEGGVVLYHYADDAVVLFSYSFPPAH